VAAQGGATFLRFLQTPTSRNKIISERKSEEGAQIKRVLGLLAAVIALAVPSAGMAEEASPCGQYHGEFGGPPAGGQAVGDAASSGLFQGGVIGDLNSNPACHL
jgi:hypothetical protein